MTPAERAAAYAKAAGDWRQEVVRRCPAMTQFCRELNTRLGSRVTVRHAFDGTGWEHGAPLAGQWVQVSGSHIAKRGKR